MQTQPSSGPDPAFQFLSDLALKLSAGEVELPSCPDIVMRVRRVLDDPNTSASKIARVVGTEPVLAARLLKLANSALYSTGRRPIADLPQAVMRLGNNMVRNSSLSIATEQLLKSAKTVRLQPHLKELWRHSVQVAAIAYVIARKFSRSNSDEAMLGGLLHDIGKLHILMQVERYPELFDDAGALDTLMEQWHTGVGKAILDAWELPEQIGVAADEHESLDRDHDGAVDLADIILVANLYAYRTDGSPKYCDIAWDSIPATGRLGLDQAASVAVLEESSEEIEAVMNALS